MSGKHTPTPWKLEKLNSTSLFTGEQSYTIAITIEEGNKIALLGENKEANAEFIIRACNSHEDLLEACKEAEECLLGYGYTIKDVLPILQKAIEKAEKGA